MGIAPGSRITVPLPDLAEFESGLVNLHRECQLPKLLKLREAGKATPTMRTSSSSIVHDSPDRASWFKGVDLYSCFRILCTVSKVPD
jgi:hypothetical protein